MKILCLHGYTQNKNLFARKASAIRKALQKAGHDLIFVSAPLKVDIADLPFDPPADSADMDMRSWWSNNEADNAFYDLSQAFQTIDKALVENGPIDGLIGFSQGAGLTAVLTQYIPRTGHPPLKFCVLYSGFIMNSEKHHHFYSTPLKTPSLHIMGSLDTVVSEERSMALFNAWSPSRRAIIKHPGGHFVPSSKPLVQNIVSFVNSHGIPPGSPREIEQAMDQDDWDQFDSIGGIKA